MDTQAWQRLAVQLTKRRASLRPEWEERTIFARDNGLSYRSLSDLETGRRDNYRTSWLTKVEQAYRLPPGSIETMLAGGDVDIADAAHQTNPSTPHASPRLEYWEEELKAPTPPLRGEEVLRWRQVEHGREYRLLDGGVSVNYTFYAHETPEDVIEPLRDLLAPHRANVERLDQRRQPRQ